MQMLRYFTLQLGSLSFGALRYLCWILMVGEELGWVGEVIAWGSGCYCAGYAPAVEFRGKVRA
jgi:hypothetical protein